MTSLVDLITMDELLRDPQYREYFLKPPVLPDHYSAPGIKPWKLIVLKKGETKWRSKKFATYQEAFAGFKKMRPSIENAAINCPALGFMPPFKTYRIKGKFDRYKRPLLRTKVWTPRIEADMASHNWCPHCRRPSIFDLATKAIVTPQGQALTEAMMRCMICGASERIVDLRHPETHQRWDANRPKVHA